ncbi:alpha/beta hydrolase [Paenibacillus beijingensis]|uniref:AB hydrolase-1 domain-containing protein n=1 Tax=Paenibacillus beijingensis TaxID=1126833 RepID=A0A0D5NJ31_9BACL|nr:alpha/beta hydrolase [Paenibacillus beijingensis]AJY75379.1 hypothetical protein VN24_13375 [Paenibacillus beijingensis]
MKKPTILFIHGAFMTPKSWDPMIRYFTAKGYPTLAPAWPFHEQEPAVLRADPSPLLSRITLELLTEHYAKIIRALPEKPILIGHSFGGLLTQLLMDRDLGLMGIAIDPAAPRGIIAGTYPTVVKSVGSILSKPWRKTGMLSLKEFKYSFVHTLPKAEQELAYEQHVVPETSRIFFQAALSALSPKSPAAVNFNNGNRGPLLIIAGEFDRIVPAAMVRKNYRLYKSGAVTDFKEFPGRTHWIIAQPGWEEVADYIEAWMVGQGAYL